MNYIELQEYLRNNHFYANKTVDLATDEICNLWVEVNSPILAQDQKARLDEVLKYKGFRSDYISNLQQIHITKTGK